MENEKVTAALASWIDGYGDVIARRIVDKFGTEIVITKDDARDGGCLSVLRGFAIGEGAGVSVDLQDAAAIDVIEHLLSKYVAR